MFKVNILIIIIYEHTLVIIFSITYVDFIIFYFRGLVRNTENINLLHHFAFNGRLLNFILTTWINGIKSCANFKIFRNETILEDVSFIVNSIVKVINER